MKTENRDEVQGMTAAYVMQHLTSQVMQQLVHKVVAQQLDELSRASALSGSILSWEMTQEQVGEIAIDCLRSAGEMLDLHHGKIGEALHSLSGGVNGQGIIRPMMS